MVVVGEGWQGGVLGTNRGVERTEEQEGFVVGVREGVC